MPAVRRAADPTTPESSGSTRRLRSVVLRLAASVDAIVEDGCGRVRRPSRMIGRTGRGNDDKGRRGGSNDGAAPGHSTPCLELPGRRTADTQLQNVADRERIVKAIPTSGVTCRAVACNARPWRCAPASALSVDQPDGGDRSPRTTGASEKLVQALLLCRVTRQAQPTGGDVTRPLPMTVKAWARSPATPRSAANRSAARSA